MIYSKVLVALLLTLCIVASSRAQEDESHYVRPSDPKVLEKLSQWQDAKFGLLMHWGTYSAWGIVESWSLCAEDEDWCRRTGPYGDDYQKYKNAYEGLKSIFNPVRFDPSRWAAAANNAGMKYVVFTTKHHDGFCMFDTKTTDYKVTSAGCAFSSNPKSNITKEIFDSFRAKGMKTGVYYSKPDWNSNDYWWRYFPTPDRHVNYDPAKYPDRWKRFQDFAYNQLEELMTGYGPVDILWLDGAWVRPNSNIPKEFESWARKGNYNQDLDIPRIAAMARGRQPGLIVVDRWVNGEYENYLTPENKVPENALGVPWEACITMATSWSYVKDDKYKPVNELVHLLVDIVAKGGNLLLNIAPSAEGDWDSVAYNRLNGVADWMKLNSEAIYNTRPVRPYKDGNVCFTEGKDGSVYAICLVSDSSEVTSRITLPNIGLTQGRHVALIGAESPVKAAVDGESISVVIPESFRTARPYRHTLTFKLTR